MRFNCIFHSFFHSNNSRVEIQIVLFSKNNGAQHGLIVSILVKSLVYLCEFLCEGAELFIFIVSP